jgi:hypothetical protein
MSIPIVDKSKSRTFKSSLYLVLRQRLEIGVILSILLSSYNLWDNSFRARVDIRPGKDIKFNCGHLNDGRNQPQISMNIAFINSGGKTAYADDIKLEVDYKKGNYLFFKTEFYSLAEYEKTIRDVVGVINQMTEVTPIVVVGKTSVVKRYLFYPKALLGQLRFLRDLICILRFVYYKKDIGKQNMSLICLIIFQYGQIWI